MNFAYSSRTEELLRRVRSFMDEHIVPRQRQWLEEVHAGQYPVSFMEDLKATAKAEGLSYGEAPPPRGATGNICQ